MVREHGQGEMTEIGALQKYHEFSKTPLTEARLASHSITQWDL
jgi:hypothetical protein